jgi:hypothetical protein
MSSISQVRQCCDPALVLGAGCLFGELVFFSLEAALKRASGPLSHHSLSAQDASFMSHASQLEHTLTSSAAGENSTMIYSDQTLTPLAADAQSIYSEQSLSFVDGAPDSTPQTSVRVARKGSRVLPSVPRSKGDSSTPRAAPMLASTPSTGLVSPMVVDSPLAPTTPGPQPSSGSVRKVGWRLGV